MNEKVMVADTLAGINGELTRYGEMIPQTENPQLKQTLKQMRNQCEMSQEEIYQIARARGYYVPAAQAVSGITEEKTLVIPDTLLYSRVTDRQGGNQAAQNHFRNTGSLVHDLGKCVQIPAYIRSSHPNSGKIPTGEEIDN